jgi:phosphatidate cytidylyltransferase
VPRPLEQPFRARLITAALLLAGFIAAVLLLGRVPFTVLVGGIVALAAYEWAKLCKFGRGVALAYTGAAVAVFTGLNLWLFPVSAAERPEAVVFLLALAFWGVAVPVWFYRGVGRAGAGLVPVAGFAVILPAALAMVALSPVRLLLVLALVWIADTAAYLAGRAFGRHKLAPAISPGKTWEGVAGAMVGSLAYAGACAALVPSLRETIGDSYMWAVYLTGAAVLCGVSVLGDLFESAIKRLASVKDSGTLLPGHGGILDRIDSATAALPVAALLLQGLNPT